MASSGDEVNAGDTLKSYKISRPRKQPFVGVCEKIRAEYLAFLLALLLGKFPDKGVPSQPFLP